MAQCPKCFVPEGVRHSEKCPELIAKLKEWGFDSLEAYDADFKKNDPYTHAMMHGYMLDN